MKKKWMSSLLLPSLLAGGVALAEPRDRPPPPRTPPEEAFNACASMSEGDSCTAHMPDHDVTGTCTLGHESRLWCRPSEPPPPRPPQ